jgi:PIN domain nuclease of toxin-antitoxin system
MKFLLDTHTFLWFVNDNPRLSDQLKDLIEDENNASYLSLASLWEMSIKYSLGKLKFDTSYEEFIEEEVGFFPT